jgi:hypothetical protein
MSHANDSIPRSVLNRFRFRSNYIA